MTVRELMKELVDCDMDDEVTCWQTLINEKTGEKEQVTFELLRTSLGHNEVLLVIGQKDSVSL